MEEEIKESLLVDVATTNLLLVATFYSASFSFALAFLRGIQHVGASRRCLRDWASSLDHNIAPASYLKDCNISLLYFLTGI
jgi:hypothetical protein